MDPLLTTIRDLIIHEYHGLWLSARPGCPSDPEYTVAVIQGLVNCRDAVAAAFGEKPDHLCRCHGQSSIPHDSGEWMLDFALTTTYPSGKSGDDSAFLTCPAKKCGILLAAESEWGGPDDVLYDFWK